MRCVNKKRLIVFMLFLLVTGISPGFVNAFLTVNRLKGQSVYAPVYSHIYHGDRERPFHLAATLSIRNTDSKQMITLRAADYFDSDGNLLRKYIKEPIQLKNLASIRYVIKSSDKSGGSGAKFIVRWQSNEPVNLPLIEAIMISTASQQGVSFVSRGQAIEE